MKALKVSLFFVALITLFVSCYYDNEEYLYGGNTNCDTTDFTFATRVYPIIENNCLSGCHSQSSGSGGIVLEGYVNVVNSAASGDLMCTILQNGGGCSPMPKNSPKLSDCDINAVQTWIDNGSPEN